MLLVQIFAISNGILGEQYVRGPPLDILKKWLAFGDITKEKSQERR
jgi:hypothetical protein